MRHRGEPVATNTDVETLETIYRYPMPWWWYWALLTPAGICASVLFNMIRAVRNWGPAWAGSLNPEFLWLVLGGPITMAAVAWTLAQRRAMETNAWVRLDDDGITVSDWRRRRSHLDWEDVQQMYWRLGKASAPASTIHVRGEGRTLRIPVEDLRGRLGPLAEEIAARARLTLVYENRWDFGARYEA
jgi:hypothetical protein